MLLQAACNPQQQGPPQQQGTQPPSQTMLLSYTLHRWCHRVKHQPLHLRAWRASGVHTASIECALTLTVSPGAGDGQQTSRKVRHCLESLSGQLSTSPHRIRDQVSSLSGVSKGGAPAEQLALCAAHHC